MIKKLLLTGILLAGTCAVYAEDEFQYPSSDGIWYTVIDAEQHFVKTKGGSVNTNVNEPSITYGNTVSGAVIIPQTVDNDGQNYTVVEIGEYGFSSELTSITLPPTIKRIGDAAFYNTGLTSIEIPESVATIGAHAFQGCASLTSVNLTEGLNSIGAFAFMNCIALESITLPASLDAIGGTAFTGCSKLNSVTSLNVYPPAISAGTFPKNSGSTLYVPNQALTAYKNSLWAQQIPTIKPIPVPSEGVSLDRNAMIVYVNGTNMPLHATAYPASTTEEISWQIEPAGYIERNNGLIKGIKAGEAVITVTCGDYTDKCVVTVKNLNEPDYIYVDLPDTNIYVGDEYQFTATIYPQNPNSIITWSTSNEDVATINSATGLLSAVKEGTIIVYAQCEEMKGAREIHVHSMPANNIDIDKFAVELQAQQTYQLSAQVNPANTTDKTLVWKSSNENVAVVNNGLITALSEGEATITVSCGPFAYNTCEVTVVPTPASEIMLSETSVNLKPTQSQQITFTVLPETTSDKTVVWTSLNPETVEVSMDGVITAKASGNAEIVAKCGNVSTVCKVSVEEIVPEEILINMAQLSLHQNESAQLTANRQVEWSSDNEEVVTVTSDGLVVATGVGKSTITAKDGVLEVSCDVTVEPTLAEEIKLNEGKVVVNVNNTKELKASILPLTTTDKTIEWTSDSPEIASVEDGVITGKAAGNAIITAVCGPVKAICNVTVLSPAQAVILNTSSVEIKIGEIEGLVAKIEPFDSTDTLVTWTSSNPTVAEVNSFGIVQGISEGDTIITATCGDKTANCVVKVLASEPTNSIDINTVPQNGIYEVYSIDGIHVMTTTDGQKLHNLPAGVYIINGHKTMIK